MERKKVKIQLYGQKDVKILILCTYIKLLLLLLYSFFMVQQGRMEKKIQTLSTERSENIDTLYTHKIIIIISAFRGSTGKNGEKE